MQPRLRRTIPTLGALALTLLLARAAQAGPFLQPSDELAAEAGAMLERVNQARQSAGLAPYVVNAALAQAAQGHAEEIAEFAHYSHTSRDGRKAKDRVLQAGYAAGREGLHLFVVAVEDHRGLRHRVVPGRASTYPYLSDARLVSASGTA